MRREAVAALVGLCLCWLCGSAAAQGEFSVVPAAHWAYEYGGQLAQDGLLLPEEWAGSEEGFTRGQFAILVSRALGRSEALKDSSATGGPEAQTDASILRQLASEFATELERLGWSAERVAESAATLEAPSRTVQITRGLVEVGDLGMGGPLGRQVGAGVEVEKESTGAAFRVVGAAPFEGVPDYSATGGGLSGPGIGGYYLGAGASVALAPSGSASLSLAAIPTDGMSGRVGYSPRLGADVSLSMGPFSLATEYFRTLDGALRGASSRSSLTAASSAPGTAGTRSAVSYTISQALEVSSIYSRIPGVEMGLEDPAARAAMLEGLGGAVRVRLGAGSAVGAGYERYRSLDPTAGLVLTRFLAGANMSISERFRLAFDLELRSLAGGAREESAVGSDVSLGYDLGEDSQIRLRYRVEDWRNESREERRSPMATAEMTVRL